MGVVQERRGNEAELARAWVEGRTRVLRATTRSFPAVGSVMVEAAVDQAWAELYEQGQAGSPERLLRCWKGLAYLRALNGVRDRRRHPVSSVSVEELADVRVLDRGEGLLGIEELRAQARAQEIMHQVSGDARLWVEAVLDDPAAPPRELARTLGWDREKLKTVARRARARLRAFVSARASGVICERRQAVMAAFAATQLDQRDPERAEQLGEHVVLSDGLYEQVALHIAGCEECERAWRQAQQRLLRPQLVLFPVIVAGKLATAGAATIAAGRRVLGRLDRLVFEARARVGSGMGRATAGGVAGTAGTAGALAGKGAAVCVGVLCATGAGTAALVGLPTGIVASQTASHHHRRAAVVRHSSQDHSGSVATAAAIASVTGAFGAQTTVARSGTSSTRTGGSSQHTGTARAAGRPTHPVTPGSLIATSPATSAHEAESQPSAHVASVASTSGTSGSSESTSTSADKSEVTTEYVPSASSSSRSSSSGSAHRPCVPGSLSC